MDSVTDTTTSESAPSTSSSSGRASLEKASDVGNRLRARLTAAR
jgi:hypothetical protein